MEEHVLQEGKGDPQGAAVHQNVVRGVQELEPIHAILRRQSIPPYFDKGRRAAQ